MKNESKKQKAKQGQLYTVHALSMLLGTDRNTINRHIAAAKIKPAKTVNGNKVYHRKPIEDCLRSGGSYADLRAEQIRQQTRESKERADILAMEKLEKSKDLLRTEEVQQLIGAFLLPIKQRFDSLASECCSLTNPTDPKFAHAALSEWANHAKRIIMENLPKVKSGDSDDEVRIIQPAG